MTQEAPLTSEPKRITARTRRARIAGVVACVPEGVIENSDFARDFGESAEQVIKMTGVRQRHVVADGQTTADLCERAALTLFERAKLDPRAVDVVIFVSQTPDFRLPATACRLQNRLGIAAGAAAFDINLGCSAYPYALWLAAMMIETGSAERVLLLVGDTISRTVDPSDRSTAMLFGDCGTATLVQASADDAEMNFVIGTDGSGWRNLIIPEGGFRGAEPDERNTNAADSLFMEGGEIFAFTLKAVPRLVRQALETSGKSIDDVDAFLFHQANEFMLKHLIKKTKIPAEKAPINIGRFGNTSSATIPLLIATDLAEGAKSIAGIEAAMFGFGVGYSWGACVTRLAALDAAELVTL